MDVPVHGYGPRVGDGVVEVLEEGTFSFLLLHVQAQRVAQELQIFLFDIVVVSLTDLKNVKLFEACL